jgi:hypothetical protein
MWYYFYYNTLVGVLIPISFLLILEYKYRKKTNEKNSIEKIYLYIEEREKIVFIYLLLFPIATIMFLSFALSHIILLKLYFSNPPVLSQNAMEKIVKKGYDGEFTHKISHALEASFIPSVILLNKSTKYYSDKETYITISFKRCDKWLEDNYAGQIKTQPLKKGYFYEFCSSINDYRFSGEADSISHAYEKVLCKLIP